MNKLYKKTAIITGGNGGIGYATAQLFKGKGATVIITGRNAAVNGVASVLGAAGYISDRVNQKQGLNSDEIAGFNKVLIDKTLLKRFGQVEEIAQLTGFLTSDDSTFITGTEMVIDGALIVNPIVQ